MAANTHRVVASFAQNLAVIHILSSALAQPAPRAVLFSPILSAFQFALFGAPK